MPEIGEIRRADEIGHKGSYKFIWQACQSCGKERWVIINKGEPVSRFCHPCAVNTPQYKANQKKIAGGSRSRFWQGGRFKNSNGYILIWLSPNDFFYSMANTKGYVFEHRLVVAKALGRYLARWEIIHHRNGIKDDNRLENLHLTMTQYHSAHIIENDLKEYIRSLEEHIKGLRQQNKEYSKRIGLLEAKND